MSPITYLDISFVSCKLGDWTGQGGFRGKDPRPHHLNADHNSKCEENVQHLLNK